LAWAAAAGFDPRGVPFPAAFEAYRFLGEGKNAASLKQIRAALSFAYKHWDLKNPFAKIEPPLHKEPQIRYLLLSDIRRLLDYLIVTGVPKMVSNESPCSTNGQLANNGLGNEAKTWRCQKTPTLVSKHDG
jgi:hypothetical protein